MLNKLMFLFRRSTITFSQSPPSLLYIPVAAYDVGKKIQGWQMTRQGSRNLPEPVLVLNCSAVISTFCLPSVSVAKLYFDHAGSVLLDQAELGCLPETDVIALLTVIVSGTVSYTQVVAFTSLTFRDDITLALPSSYSCPLSVSLCHEGRH